MGLFSKSFKLIAIAFNIISPHLYTAAYEISIIQSSAAGHQLTPCSTGPPFFISPHRQTFHALFQFGEKVKSRGAKFGK
jgi:hypothetical protein